MSIIHKEIEFNSEGLALLNFRDPENGEIYEIYCRNTVLRNTKGYDNDWKYGFNRITRGELIYPTVSCMVFRINLRYHRLDEFDYGCIAIGKSTKFIIAAGHKVPDNLYDEVLLWFHRLMRIAQE